MHMANELLSLPVSGSCLVLAAGALGWVCKKCKQSVPTDQFALMGVLGAFIFAAQMINIQLPGMPGTSGHMIGAVLLAIILGPHAGALVLSSVVFIQCLIFQDGGLLALGCNLINMALVPSYVGYWVYTLITGRNHSDKKAYAGAILGALVTVELGALLVPIQAQLSGILLVPLRTFVLTMVAVHLIIGLLEGVLTVAVLAYLRQVKPDVFALPVQGGGHLSRKALLSSLMIATLFIAGVVSLFASDLPDGLEWSAGDRPDQPEVVSFIAEPEERIASVDLLHAKIALAPDYTPRTSPLGQLGNDSAQGPATWTSVIGVLGSLFTMVAIWLTAKCIRHRPLITP